MPMQIGIGLSLTLTEDDGVAGVGDDGPSGDGRLLEDGVSYRLLEDGTSYRILE